MAWFKKDTKEKKEPLDEQEAAPAVAAPKAGDSRSYTVIRGPHVTEKASNSASLGKYVFRVGPDANKLEVRRSIEKLYKVKVASVHMLIMPSKFRQVGRHHGERSGYKKAVVTLRPGEKIDIT
ncbi:MAG: 50S ribosomal protein L23 [Patescibacteria group bacterium]